MFYRDKLPDGNSVHSKCKMFPRDGAELLDYNPDDYEEDFSSVSLHRNGTPRKDVNTTVKYNSYVHLNFELLYKTRLQ